MKSLGALLLVLLLFVAVSSVQSASAQPTRTDVITSTSPKPPSARVQRKVTSSRNKVQMPPCRDTTSFFGTKVARTGITL